MRAVRNDQLTDHVTFVDESEGIHEYRLSNGMKVLLVENRVAPVSTLLVLYKVGSRNEAVGHTGATHLLEHLLFKGTPTFNTERNTQIAATLQKIGADFNATTWYDRTNYFETFPSDQLELAVELEADRMRNSFIAEGDRQSEMTVVRNELERGENEPSIVLEQAVYATAFREHPYHHPTIGWRSDVEHVPTARLKLFYDTFYHPNNATVILAGDFERAEALSLIAERFGAHPATAEPIPEVYTDEPPQEGERRLVVRRAGELALVQIAFHTPGALGQLNVLSTEELSRRAAAPPADNDIYPLVVLSTLLSHGVTSRLYQALVEQEYAVTVNANVDQFRDPGLFNVYATVCPGIEPQKIEEVVLAELRRIRNEEVAEAEAEKAKQQILAQVAYDRDGTHNIAVQISEAEAVADWRFYKDYAANIARVTPADAARAARAYLSEDNRTIGYFIPKTNGREPGKTSRGSAQSGDVKADHAPSHAAQRMMFHHKPGADGAPGEETGGQTEQDQPTGGSATPPAKEQPPLSPHGNGSSKAAPKGRPAVPLRSQYASFSERIARAQLPNGACVLSLENRATPIISLHGSLRTGSYFEPHDKPGLARLTAELLERGTQKRSKIELAGDLERVGAEIDFSVDPFAVRFAARSLAKDLPRLITALAEQLREPAFPADELAKLKQQTIAAIQEQQSNTRHRAYERFTQLIYDPANPFYVPSGEQLIDSINATSVEDVRRFYTQYYGGRSLILAVAGGVKNDEVEQLFQAAFTGFDGPAEVNIDVPNPSPQTAAQREVLFLKDKANIDILLGSAAPLRRDTEDYYAAKLANNALGESTLSSRLGLQVRDREGLTYGIGSRFRAPSLAAGPWYIAVSAGLQNVEKAIDSALEVLRDYVQNGIRPDELADEKSAAIGSFKVSLATTAGLAEALWNAEFYNLGTDHLDRYGELINSVTLEEANGALRKYFRPDHLTVVIAGDYEALGQSASAPVS